MFDVQEMTLVIDSYSNLSFILKDDIQEMAQIIDSYSFFSYLFCLYLCFQDGVNFCCSVCYIIYPYYFWRIYILTANEKSKLDAFYLN